MAGDGKDDKGRPVVDSLSDRALLEEIAFNQRAIIDTLMAIGQNPMVGAFMPQIPVRM